MVHIVLFYAISVAFIGCIKRKNMISIAFIILFVFAALRYGYGNDYFSYLKWYQYIQQGGQSPYDEEILFTLLNEVMPSFQMLVVFTSAVFIGTSCYLIRNTLDNSYACIGLLIFVINPYLFLMNLSALRQSMAIACFLIATRRGIAKKPIGFLAWILIGCLFHKSAIILLPTYFLMKEQKINWKHILALVIAVLVVVGFVDLGQIINQFADMFNDANYLSHANNGISNSLRATLLTGIGFLYIAMNLPKLHGSDQVYAKLYLISLIFGIFAYQVSMLTRIQMYFDIFAVVSLPRLVQINLEDGAAKYSADDWLEGVKQIFQKYILPFLVFLVYVLRYYSFFTNSAWSAFFEYYTIFSVL